MSALIRGSRLLPTLSAIEDIVRYGYDQEIGFTRHQTLQCLNLGLPNLQSCEKEILLIISHPVHGTVITANKLSTLMCKKDKESKRLFKR